MTPIRIFSRDEQADGQFNGGAILEKKPIGFPQDGGKLRPYSNLFYWAYAWSEGGSTIGEHPHKGFEIMSFVLRGEIEHYDNQFRGWKKLMAGDAQIIRAGNGITHAERMHEGSAMFQIWFDPDLSKSINKSPSYNDFTSEKFPIQMENGKSFKTYKGDNAPIEMDATGIFIQEISLAEGHHLIHMKKDSMFSAFVLEGTLTIENNHLNNDDFFVINDVNGFHLEASSDVRIFAISSPIQPPYKTYAQMHGLTGN